METSRRRWITEDRSLKLDRTEDCLSGNRTSLNGMFCIRLHNLLMDTSKTRWTWFSLLPQALCLSFHHGRLSKAFRPHLRSVPFSISLPLYLTFTGGLNTCSRALAAFLLPVDGEPLVSVCTLMFALNKVQSLIFV